MESILIHDWRLMGRTSLLMFPIYGCGALLAPIGRLADLWIGDVTIKPHGLDHTARPALYGAYFYGRVSVGCMFYTVMGDVPLELYRVIRPV